MSLSSNATLKDLKSHPYYKQIKGRSSMNKEELYDALSNLIETKSTKSNKNTISNSIETKSTKSNKNTISNLIETKSTKNINNTNNSVLITMPKEIHEKLFMDMEPQVLAAACVTDKRAMQICTDDNFWENYYRARGLPFKRYSYPYLRRIMEARSQALYHMSIDEIELISQDKEIDKLTLDILSRTDFWEKYWNIHKMFNFHKNNYKKISERIKEFRIQQWVIKMGSGYNTKLRGNICGNDIKLVIKYLKLSDRDKLSKLKPTDDCIQVLVYISQPDYFKFKFSSSKNNMEIFADHDFLFNIFDLIVNKKIIGQRQ